LEQDARDLQALLNQPPEPVARRPPRPRPADPEPAVEGVGPPPATDSPAPEPPPTQIEPVAPTPPPPPADVRTPDQRLADAVRELASLLRERVSASPSPWADALLLAALAASYPAALPNLRDELIGSNSGLTIGLSPAELRSLHAATTLLADWAGRVAPTPDAGSPARSASLLSAAASALGGEGGMRLPVVALCTRVEGFGQYDPLPTLTLSAGRPVRAVLYVEVDGFAHQSHTTPGNWAVELTQEVRVVHDADGSLQWYRPEQRVLDVSRNRRRDFFLVQTIDLPPTLSVGNYTLRVTVRDLAPTREGRPPQQAEATLRFAVIADASAARIR
jgi:hypothetical protein